MQRKTIFTLAAEFDSKLRKIANYPSKETMLPIVENVVNSIKGRNPVLKSVKSVASLSVQNTLEGTMLTYFQLVVDPNQYQQLINEPYKTEITSSVKGPVEEALKSAFPAFNFRVTVGIVS